MQTLLIYLRNQRGIIEGNRKDMLKYVPQVAKTSLEHLVAPYSLLLVVKRMLLN